MKSPLLILAVTLLPVISFAAGLVPCGTEGPDCNFGSLIQLIQGIIDFILLISPAVAAIGFVWAGILLFTSAGDEGKVRQAKEIFINTALGFIIILGAWFVVKALLIGIGGGESPFTKFLNF